MFYIFRLIAQSLHYEMLQHIMNDEPRHFHNTIGVLSGITINNQGA